MRQLERFILAAAAVAVVALTAPIANATMITCSDNGGSYSDTCAGVPTGTACISTLGTQNGCCNKGTCNSGGNCITGDPQDAACLNDSNDCTDDVCNQNPTTHQPTCTHSNSPTTRVCNLDSNVCTVDKCNGAGACASTGVTNTCAQEQIDNPAEEPICKPWKCNPSTGCAKTNVDVDGSPLVACTDGKDCTTGDHCVNGNCEDSGTAAPAGYPCRDDDVSQGNGDNRTWCQAGVCDGHSEACKDVENIPNGGSCDPNPCTTAHCVGAGASGVCTIDSCNVGTTVNCEPCGTTWTCVQFLETTNANQSNACGCRSTF